MIFNSNSIYSRKTSALQLTNSYDNSWQRMVHFPILLYGIIPFMVTPFRILGIDPGLERTGYGLIEVETDQSSCLKAQGIFKSSRTLPLEERLTTLHCQLFAFLEEQNPDVVVLEQLYSHYDHPVTAILMGHARGIICLAAAQRKIPLVSYAATRIKKAVTGNGGASKEQVQRMVYHLLGVKEIPGSLDVTDALALALAHANVMRLSGIQKVPSPLMGEGDDP
jgi:crossover junction endodeoxyribonuclease RuvC